MSILKPNKSLNCRNIDCPHLFSHKWNSGSLSNRNLNCHIRIVYKKIRFATFELCCNRKTGDLFKKQNLNAFYEVRSSKSVTFDLVHK